jgi:hypothetical protein
MPLSMEARYDPLDSAAVCSPVSVSDTCLKDENGRFPMTWGISPPGWVSAGHSALVATSAWLF